MKLLLISFVSIFLFSNINIFAATNKSKKTATGAVSEVSCSTIIIDGQTPMAGFENLTTEYTLDDLITTDKTKNLAWKHPSIVMNAGQKLWHVISYYPKREILDPNYRVEKRTNYPIFTNGKLVNKMIVGHYDVQEDLVKYIYDSAIGAREGMMFLLRGPAGTGKTELLMILELGLAKLSHIDPNYYQYTYYWKDLYKVAGTKGLFFDENKDLPYYTIKRSPFVLLPASLQKKLVAFVEPRVRERTGLPPLPFTGPDNKSQEIINAIVAHYLKEEGKNHVTEEDYLRWIGKHVSIVRKLPDDVNASGIIRFQGKNPKYGNLFMTEHMSASEVYGTESALSYHYTGKVPRTDGGPQLWDEFFRQVPDLRNTVLDIAQNGMIEVDGIPPLKADTIVIGASNDESIEEAEQEGGAKAHLDRTIRRSMRLEIHPTLVSKTSLITLGTNMFLMSENKPGSKFVPADINILYPEPTEDGKLSSPDGKYTILYHPDDTKKSDILIAPQTLYFLGLTSAGTRLVFDEGKLKEFEEELSLVRKGDQGFQHFISLRNRLKILMDKMQVTYSIRQELSRVRKMLKEGRVGVSARELRPWFSEAVLLAERNENTMTPAVLDQAFKNVLDDEKIVTTDKRNAWLKIHQMVKSDFILPELVKDVRAIVAGESGQVDNIYEEVREELLALASDKNAQEWENRKEGKNRPINMKRLKQINVIYHELNNQELTPGAMAAFKTQSQDLEEKFEPLYRAIEQYLLETVLDTQSLDGLVDYFRGKPVSHSVTELGIKAKNNFTKSGYNLRAFVEALVFIRDQQHYIEMQRQKPQE